MRPITIKSLEFLKSKFARLSPRSSRLCDLDWSNLTEEQGSELIKLLHRLDERVHSRKLLKQQRMQDRRSCRGGF